MQFVSFGFLIFLPLAVLINFIVPRKFRYIWMLLISLAFYISLDLKAAGVLAVTVVLNYAGGILLGRRADGPVDKGTSAEGAGILSDMEDAVKKADASKGTAFDSAESSVAGSRTSKPRRNSSAFILAVLIIIDIAMLFVFRSGSILGAIGISFYMLKAIGYLIDVYRCDTRPERNFAKFALFVSFFPQIVSGPIDRARNLLPQFDYPMTVDFDRLREGLLQMLWGYGLKLVLADRLAIFVGKVFDAPHHYPGTIVFIATIFYTFEIYCDFAGYSHIAIGIAKILGIDVKKNFDAPYLSGSIAEFWRRWHISLSTWLRDYVYIPLGGNRKGTGRKYLNILIVFAVSGIWHGSARTFLVWGMLHGLYQVIGYVLMPVRDKVAQTLKVDRSSFSHRAIKIVVTFLLVNTAWVFFRADCLQTAFNVLKGSLEFTPWVLTDGSLYNLGLNQKNFTLLILGLILLIIVDILEYRGVELIDRILKQGLWLRWIIGIAGVLLVLICGIWGPGYDAASFIYQQF